MTDVNGTLVAVPPPPGYVVDFKNPERQLQTQVYTVIVVENILALAFLMQRLYTRIHLMRLFQVEDGETDLNLPAESNADISQELFLVHGSFP